MLNKIIAFLTLLSIYSGFAFSQTCNHTNLSLKYDYKVSVKREKDEDGSLGIRKIIVEIINKSTKRTEQTIVVNPKSLYPHVFKDCSSTRSYITGFNKKKEIQDGDYGDLIVRELNFDGKEDLAIKSGNGGFAGPEYKIFTTRKNGTLQEDDFLSNGGFPDAINYKNKTLSFSSYTLNNGILKSVFKYNVAAGKWKNIK